MTQRSGQVAVVLGASGGLGFGLARRFAADGAALVIADIESAELARAEKELIEGGAEVLAVQVDVVKPEQVDALARAAIDRFGRVDMVCNTVGVAIQGTSWELPLEDWRWMFDVNVWGVVHVIRSFTPILIEQGEGHIVHTASTVALTTRPDNPAYIATKHTVLSICESLQQDLRAAGSGVKVSVLIPGLIRSRMYEATRNRQPEYGESQISEEQRTEMRDYFEQFGADPDVLAGIIVEQLDQGRFYVFGRDGDLALAETRVEGMQTGFLPDPTFVASPGPGARAEAVEPG